MFNHVEVLKMFFGEDIIGNMYVYIDIVGKATNMEYIMGYSYELAILRDTTKQE